MPTISEAHDYLNNKNRFYLWLSSFLRNSRSTVDWKLPVSGLGKGGAKRHLKVLRDNIQGDCLFWWDSGLIDKKFAFSYAESDCPVSTEFCNAVENYKLDHIKVLPSPPLVVWLAEVVSNASAVWSTKKHAVFWRLELVFVALFRWDKTSKMGTYTWKGTSSAYACRLP